MADTATEPTLRLGDSGADGWVEYLQKLLTHRGHPAEINGTFDDTTHQAVLGFQGRHGLLVDGVVGNQTWAALREEAPRAIGTDGLEPGTFEETGVEARWFTEEGPPIFDAEKDLLGLPAISTGDAPIAAGQFTADATITNEGTGESQSFVLGSVTQTGEPAQPGEFVFFAASGWQQLPDGTYTVTATLPAELGGDQADFRFQKGGDPGPGGGGGGGETGPEFGIEIEKFEADSASTKWTARATGRRGGAGIDNVVWATDDGAETFTSDVAFEVGPGGRYAVQLATPTNIKAHWDEASGRSFTVILTTNSGAHGQGEMDNASTQVPGWSGGV